MTPKFLREEAARFRGMADEHTREASKLRLLSMATDYEARATAGDGLVVAAPVEETAPALPEGGEVEANNPEASVKMALGLKDSTLAARRPVGRPRLRLAT
jgi:hypothetical protein